MVVGCISESTRLDQEWCSKFIHSVETVVAVGSEYQVILQRAKKVLSDSPGLVDFAIGLVNSVFNLPDGQVMFYEEFE